MGVTWQMLAVGHLPLQSDRLRPTVDSASEGRCLPDTHHGAVGLDGDDGALEACSREQRAPSGTPACLRDGAGTSGNEGDVQEGEQEGEIMGRQHRPDWASRPKVQLKTPFVG